MSMNDPISDMLTRLRNGARNRAKSVTCLNSKVCRGVAKVLQDEGYIEGFDVIEDGRSGQIRVRMRYDGSGQPLFSVMKRESTPGCRVYRGHADLASPLGGLGVCIVSTSRGVMSDRACREGKVGGELLATVY